MKGDGVFMLQLLSFISWELLHKMSTAQPFWPAPSKIRTEKVPTQQSPSAWGREPPAWPGTVRTQELCAGPRKHLLHHVIGVISWNSLIDLTPHFSSNHWRISFLPPHCPLGVKLLPGPIDELLEIDLKIMPVTIFLAACGQSFSDWMGLINEW